MSTFSIRWRSPFILTSAAVAVVAAGHAALVWRNIGLHWGDYGVWLHQVERVAAGEVLYRDVYVSSPPLGYWVFGLGARVVGTELAGIWLLTHVLYGAITVLFLLYVRRVVPSPLLVPTALASFVLAIALANRGSAPLPLGLYIPAAVVGGSLLLAGICCALPLLDVWSAKRALVVGALAGAMVLAKHDFWAPALVLVAAPVWLHRRPHAAIAAAGVVVTGVLYIGLQAGWPAIPGLLTGFGLAAEYGVGRSAPSLERITVHLLMLSVFALFFLGARALVGPTRTSRPAVLAAGAVLLCAAAYSIGTALYAEAVVTRGLSEWPGPVERTVWERNGISPLPKTIAFLLRPAVYDAPLSLFLPLTLLALVVLRAEDRRLPTFLLALFAAAQLRRGFEHNDWAHALIGVPASVVALYHVYGRVVTRQLALSLAGILVLAGGVYHWHARGLFTRRPPWDFVSVQTPRGIVKMRPGEAHVFDHVRRVVAELDPERRRPLFMFGHNGAYNYWLRRVNPTPATFGFLTSPLAPDSVLSILARLRPIVLDHRTYHNAGVPTPGIHLASWEIPHRENHYIRFDRPYFERLIAGCQRIAPPRAGPRPYFTIYDCPGGTDAQAHNSAGSAGAPASGP